MVHDLSWDLGVIPQFFYVILVSFLPVLCKEQKLVDQKNSVLLTSFVWPWDSFSNVGICCEDLKIRRFQIKVKMFTTSFEKLDDLKTWHVTVFFLKTDPSSFPHCQPHPMDLYWSIRLSYVAHLILQGIYFLVLSCGPFLLKIPQICHLFSIFKVALIVFIFNIFF